MGDFLDDENQRQKAAGCDHETTDGPQPTRRPHVQENVAGAITNLQLWS